MISISLVRLTLDRLLGHGALLRGTRASGHSMDFLSRETTEFLRFKIHRSIPASLFNRSRGRRHVTRHKQVPSKVEGRTTLFIGSPDEIVLSATHELRHREHRTNVLRCQNSGTRMLTSVYTAFLPGRLNDDISGRWPDVSVSLTFGASFVPPTNASNWRIKVVSSCGMKAGLKCIFAAVSVFSRPLAQKSDKSLSEGS